MVNPSIEKLLRAVHDPNLEDLSDFTIVIRHRGAPNDEKEIDGSNIKFVKKSGFKYEDEEGMETFILGHRILEIRER